MGFNFSNARFENFLPYSEISRQKPNGKKTNVIILYKILKKRNQNISYKQKRFRGISQ